MGRGKYILLVVLMGSIFLGTKIAVGHMGEGHESRMMMGDEMKEESCEKEPGMHDKMMQEDMGMHKRGEHMMKRDMMMEGAHQWEYLNKSLNLTDEQANKLGKIYSDYKKEMLRKKADIEIAGMELGELLKTRESDEKAIEESVNNLESLRSNLNMYRVKALLKTREFLSDEQYKGLANLILGWMGPHKMMGEPHGCMRDMR